MIFLHNMLPGEKTKVCFKCSAVKPIDVIWLCEKHHADIHRLYKQMKDFDLYKNEMWQNTNKRQR